MLMADAIPAGPGCCLAITMVLTGIRVAMTALNPTCPHPSPEVNVHDTSAFSEPPYPPYLQWPEEESGKER